MGERIVTDTSFADEIASNGTAKSSAFHLPAGFAPPAGAALFLQLALTLFMIVQAAACGIVIIVLSLIQRVNAGEFTSEEQYLQEAGWVVTASELAFPVSLGAFLLCIAAYCFFVYRAASNIQNANARGLDHSPAASVYLGFIPLANLFYIFNIMKGIWVASHDPKRGVYAMSILLPVWWGLYVASNIVSRFSENMMQAAIDNGNFDNLATMSWVSVASGAGLIVSSIILIVIIRAITHAQSTWLAMATDPA